MANQKHLKILEQGVDAWNEWRRKNPGIEPDLRDAQLPNKNLRGAYLREADLSGADLREPYRPKL